MSTAYDVVRQARSQDKASTPWLIEQLVTHFHEFHGDREHGDDPAIIGGVGFLGDQAVTVIGTNKGRTLAESQACHFGCATPEGYRKAIRLMRQAAKFRRPVLNLINTPGAYPGVEAEYHGQGDAIAQCILTGVSLPVPTISVIVGEAGSGGALAWRAETKLGCSRKVLTPFCRRKGMPRFCGAMVSARLRRLNKCG